MFKNIYFILTILERFLLISIKYASSLLSQRSKEAKIELIKKLRFYINYAIATRIKCNTLVKNTWFCNHNTISFKWISIEFPLKSIEFPLISIEFQPNILSKVQKSKVLPHEPRTKQTSHALARTFCRKKLCVAITPYFCDQ